MEVLNYIPPKLRDQNFFIENSDVIQHIIDSVSLGYLQKDTVTPSLIDAINDKITVTDRLWKTGQAVILANISGVPPSGLQTYTTYWIYVSDTSPVKKVQFYTGYQLAFSHTAAGRVQLLDVGSGEFEIVLAESLYGDGISSIQNKYKDYLNLQSSVAMSLNTEHGFDYITDILELTDGELKAFLGYVSLINALKGSRKGLETVLSIIGCSPYLIYEWWELLGQSELISILFGTTNTNTFTTNQSLYTVTTEPYTFFLRVYINEEKSPELLQSIWKIKQFIRNYVYPVLIKLDVLSYSEDKWIKPEDLFAWSRYVYTEVYRPDDEAYQNWHDPLSEETLFTNNTRALEFQLMPTVPTTPHYTNNGGHYETVIDVPAWDQTVTVIERIFDPALGDLTNLSLSTNNLNRLTNTWHETTQAVSVVIHHQAITHEEYVFGVVKNTGWPLDPYKNIGIVESADLSRADQEDWSIVPAYFNAWIPLPAPMTRTNTIGETTIPSPYGGVVTGSTAFTQPDPLSPYVYDYLLTAIYWENWASVDVEEEGGECDIVEDLAVSLEKRNLFDGVFMTNQIDCHTNNLEWELVTIIDVPAWDETITYQQFKANEGNYSNVSLEANQSTQCWVGFSSTLYLTTPITLQTNGIVRFALIDGNPLPNYSLGGITFQLQPNTNYYWTVVDSLHGKISATLGGPFLQLVPPSYLSGILESQTNFASIETLSVVVHHDAVTHDEWQSGPYAFKAIYTDMFYRNERQALDRLEWYATYWYFDDLAEVSNNVLWPTNSALLTNVGHISLHVDTVPYQTQDLPLEYGDWEDWYWVREA